MTATDTHGWFNHALTSYFCFNNTRTLSTSRPSQLTLVRKPGMTAYIDSTRRYDNHVVIHQKCAESDIEEVLGLYPDHLSPEISIEPAATDFSLSQCLMKHRFVPAYSHEFLAMRAESYQASPIKQEIRVERWECEKVDDFLALLQTAGVECSETVWEEKRRYYCTEQFRCFVAFYDDQPCAWATSYLIDNGMSRCSLVSDKLDDTVITARETGAEAASDMAPNTRKGSDRRVAILANAYTQEAYRGKGCQTALLHARIQDAKAAKVTHLLTDVMPDTISSRNCKAAGFTTKTIRTVWARS